MGHGQRSWRAISTGVALVVSVASPVLAQGLPSEPIVTGRGRVIIGGDVSLTASCSHAEGAAPCTSDTGFFNYSGYSDSTLRMARLGLRTAIRLTHGISVLGDFRLENASGVRPHALYMRFTPFEDRELDIQAGRVPSVFGAFSRRAYSADNPLVGYPLAYQYLLSLRPDSLPATPDDLIRMRGRGWLSNFPIGNLTADAGMPIADAFNLDTGVEVHGRVGWIEAAGSVTRGSLSQPVVRDDNHGAQVAGRVALTPAPGFVVGVSGSRAPFVGSRAAEAAHLPPAGFLQRAVGADVEYSRDHYLIRAETLLTTYEIPTIAPTLRASAAWVEGRYKLTPRLHVAARFDHLAFNRITGTIREATWEAPVTRWELGGGYALQRNSQVRLSFQHNVRDGGRVRRMTALAGQFLYWF